MKTYLAIITLTIQAKDEEDAMLQVAAEVQGGLSENDVDLEEISDDAEDED
jgi:hypothetical protein